MFVKQATRGPFFASLLFALLTLPAFIQAETIEENLPVLGDASSAMVSAQQEYVLGQSWLRALRGRTRIVHDPMMMEYYYKLAYKLVPNSELNNKKLSLIIVDSPALNAFAVPGNVMGINAGLFLNANTEQEFSSVIAHELAHLSQRHFARRVEEMERNRPLQLAGLLASVVIGAAAGGDAGIATMAGSQALAIQNQLAFSRQNEQEADRIGIKTLYRSGMDPKAMPAMFEAMLRESKKYGRRPPEYLSTHPISESRIADTRNRAEQMGSVTYQEDIEYHLMRSRTILRYNESPETAAAVFREYRENSNPFTKVAADYGLAISLTEMNQPGEALKILENLLDKSPNRITFLVAKAEALSRQKKFAEAQSLLETNLDLSPDNYPLTWTLAKVHREANELNEALKYLQQLSRQHPQETAIWYAMSELYGLVGKIVRVHQCRAEFFYLRANYDEALLQLQQAMKKSSGSYQVETIIQQRMTDVYNAKKGVAF